MYGNYNERYEVRYMERVELAVHTGHSMNNGIGAPEDFINHAKNYGMSAMAVTDIGSVTAYPLLYFEAKKLGDFKVIYGLDALVVDDMQDVQHDLIDHLPEEKIIPYDEFKKMPVTHLSILIKNEVGRRNLYELLSLSEINYGGGASAPTKIALSMLLRRKEGLLIGGGRSNGMLMDCLEKGENGDEVTDIKRITEFIDYIEISDSYFESKVRELLKISEDYNLIPVAVGAPYYTDLLGRLARGALVNTVPGWDEFEEPRNDHYMGTEAMLGEFSFLGKDKAYEIVVENTNTIADMCQLDAPYSNIFKSVSMETDMDELKGLCLQRFRTLYPDENIAKECEDKLGHIDELDTLSVNGSELDNNPVTRLIWELGAIQKADTAYMFLNIVRLKNRFGIKNYEIGSRGSVGASFVAFLLNITEIDPIKNGLSPYFFFGKNGEKEPDIDLNLRPDIQALFMKEYKNLPGVQRTIRGGTIGTISEYTADNYLTKFEEENKIKFDAKHKYVFAEMISGTVRSRGQHPGGIVPIPEGECIYDDMPIKNVGTAGDPVLTTGFDTHQLDHIYRKLDFLGHNGPEILWRLAELTGISPTSISLDDPEVMKMFEINNEDVLPNCFGVLEFSAEFMVEMLKIVKPKKFDDLVSMLGLAHGTDVWNGNAKELIESGVADISGVISTRDDVYRTMVDAGIDSFTAYNIAETVRKGRANKSRIRRGVNAKRWNELKNIMREHLIPEWYIDSCETISYLFPRAHAMAYMQCAWRMAWYKLHYPMEYYKVMIDVRYDYVNFDKIAGGIEEVKNYQRDLLSEENPYSYAVESQYTACSFFIKYYLEGYKLIAKEVSGAGPHPCQIDKENNAIIVHVKRDIITI